LDDLDWDAAEQMALNSPPASAPTDPPRPAVPPAAAPTAPAPAPCAAAAAEDDDDDAPLLALPAASGVAACTTSPAAQGSKAREDASVQRSGEKEKETRAEREARRLGFDCPGPQSKWIQEAGSDFSPQPRARKRRDVDPPPSSPTPVQSDTNAKQSDTNAKTKKPRSISASAHVANAPPGLGTEASGGGGIGGDGGGGGNGGAVPPLSHRAKCKGGGPANCSAGAEGARGRDARVGLGEEEAGQSGMRNRDERLGAGGGSGGSASGRETLVCAILALVPVCGMRGACVRHAGVRVCVRACVRA
jgi:translation initiation factor IF-2